MSYGDPWEKLGHVDPPEVAEGGRSLIFYLGPNHYPAGLYLPDGYDIESRPGDSPEWQVLRARDCTSGQELTRWAVRTDEAEDGPRVKILDP